MLPRERHFWGETAVGNEEGVGLIEMKQVLHRKRPNWLFPFRRLSSSRFSTLQKAWPLVFPSLRCFESCLSFSVNKRLEPTYRQGKGDEIDLAFRLIDRSSCPTRRCPVIRLQITRLAGLTSGSPRARAFVPSCSCP